ncbi:MAG TPA: BlaI/MecI/CopY family transcriptional regulator [Prolixibacteraceae bacterium]|nr:BlaI/MecI/CopY family transcriptional regulator [Prolixibacteraceae bacterium]
MRHLTNREEEIMELFWEKGSVFVKEIIDMLADPKPHYNTISTIVRGLEEKGFVGHEQFGNTHRYFAVISREEFSKNTIKNLVSKYFDKSYASVVSMFVEEQDISTEEIKELIRQAESRNTSTNE